MVNLLEIRLFYSDSITIEFEQQLSYLMNEHTNSKQIYVVYNMEVHL